MTYIESTARKVGGYTYSTTSGRTNGTWSQFTGYGLVDAYAAVLAASGGNGVVYFNDKNVTIATNVTGTIIYSQNVNVSNNVKLTLKGTQKVEIINDFIINSGSSLEMTN